MRNQNASYGFFHLFADLADQQLALSAGYFG